MMDGGGKNSYQYLNYKNNNGNGGTPYHSFLSYYGPTLSSSTSIPNGGGGSNPHHHATPPHQSSNVHHHQSNTSSPLSSTPNVGPTAANKRPYTNNNNKNRMMAGHTSLINPNYSPYHQHHHQRGAGGGYVPRYYSSANNPYYYLRSAHHHDYPTLLQFNPSVKLQQLGSRLQSWKTASIGISFLVLLLLICKLHDVDREINYLHFISNEWLSQQAINQQLLLSSSSSSSSSSSLEPTIESRSDIGSDSGPVVPAIAGTDGSHNLYSLISNSTSSAKKPGHNHHHRRRLHNDEDIAGNVGVAGQYKPTNHKPTSSAFKSEDDDDHYRSTPIQPQVTPTTIASRTIKEPATIMNDNNNKNMIIGSDQIHEHQPHPFHQNLHQIQSASAPSPFQQHLVDHPFHHHQSPSAQNLISNTDPEREQQDILNLANIITVISYLKEDVDIIMAELMASRTTLLLSLIFVLVYILSWCWMAYAIRATNTPQDISLKTVLLLAIFAAVDIAASAGFVMVRIIMYLMRDHYFPRDMRVPAFSIEYNQLASFVALRFVSMKSGTAMIDIFVSVIVTFLTSLRVYSVICAVTFYRRARKELLDVKNFEYMIERPTTTRYPSHLNHHHNFLRSSMVNSKSSPANSNGVATNKPEPSTDLGQSGYLPKIRLLSAHKDLERRFSINGRDNINNPPTSGNNSVGVVEAASSSDVSSDEDPAQELKIQAADMPSSIQKSAMQSTIHALRTYTTEKHIAESIKQNFDQLYEPTWHCIVGRNWGSCVTHTKSNYIRMLYKDLTILLYKSS